MAKALRCSDLMCGCDCDAVLDGEDLAEVMAKAGEHARAAHGMEAIPPQVAVEIRAAMKDKQDASRT